MHNTPTIQEIMGPVSLDKVTLSPPWLLNVDDKNRLTREMAQEYERQQTTLKAVRLSVAHAAISAQRLVFTLGERTLEDVVRGNPNWYHFSGCLPKFTKGHLGQYYKELEGLGIVSLTRSRPHGKVAPIFYITLKSPPRSLINSDFEKQLREAWEFATPLEEDVRDSDLARSYSLIPRKQHNKGQIKWKSKQESHMHSKSQTETLEIEKDQEKDLKQYFKDHNVKKRPFLQLGNLPLEAKNVH